jgi:hypothetical protein
MRDRTPALRSARSSELTEISSRLHESLYHSFGLFTELTHLAQEARISVKKEHSRSFRSFIARAEIGGKFINVEVWAAIGLALAIICPEATADESVSATTPSVGKERVAELSHLSRVRVWQKCGYNADS